MRGVQAYINHSPAGLHRNLLSIARPQHHPRPTQPRRHQSPLRPHIVTATQPHNSSRCLHLHKLTSPSFRLVAEEIHFPTLFAGAARTYSVADLQLAHRQPLSAVQLDRSRGREADSFVAGAIGRGNCARRLNAVLGDKWEVEPAGGLQHLAAADEVWVEFLHFIGVLAGEAGSRGDVETYANVLGGKCGEFDAARGAAAGDVVGGVVLD
mmetsp:Transcript_12824/g.31701  ORF Transcript_12824/g.31701 Transcript_12824/m.31701 type:complete len:210 (-) Transcript_12824:171-800(-)